jgi:two-component system cell cycle sensor histidine kinase PleC
MLSAKLTILNSLKLSLTDHFTTDWVPSARGQGFEPMIAGQPAPEIDKTAINRQRADHRRSVARAIRAQRERLTSFTGRPAFDYELTLTFARNRLNAAYALPFLVTIFAAAALLWVDVATVVTWAAAVLAVHFMMLVLCERFIAVPEAAAPIRKWRRRFATVEFVGGIAWAAILVLVPYFAGRDEGITIFQFATMLIVVSAITSLASTLPPAAVAGTVPITLVLVGLFAVRSEFLFLTLAVMALGAQFFFLMLASRLYLATLTMLEYRAQKDLLIAELGTAKSISDESRRRAEEANLAKSRFLATMSHELRTPLNAILGFSEIMMNEVLGPIENKSYREYVGDIHASGQHLLNLINEILDLSRIEAGRQELCEEPVNLGGIVEECHRLLQLRARNKNLAIGEQIEPGMPRLWADERAVRQVVLNLLSNAIKFTPAGGEIELKVGWTASGGQYVSVRDNGPGIPPEEIPIVMSSFGQGSIAIKSAEQGAGLGLPIVQALMHMHDGTFDLKSKLREGTEATAAFPRSRVMEALGPITGEEEPEVREPRVRATRNWLRAG